MSTEHTAPALEASDLCEAFARTVARRGGEPALLTSDGGVSLSWNEYDARMRAVAGGLRALGVQRGGTVAMLLTNRPEAAITDMAALHLGAVPVSAYNSSSIAQLAYVIDDAGADALVSEAAFADRAKQAIAQAQRDPKLVVVDGDAEADAGTFDALCALGTPLAAGERPGLDPDDTLTVVYTSGTTGDPKGAELTHYNILEQIRGLHSLGRLPDGGRALSYLPMAHMGDRLCAYYMPIVMGASITYHADPRTAALELPQVQPTLFMAVPRVWQKLQGAAEDWTAKQPDEQREQIERAIELGSQLHDDRVAGREQDPAKVEQWKALDPALKPLRRQFGFDGFDLVFTGAAPLPPETLRYYAAIGVDLCECYGQSETAGIILCNPADRPRPITNGLPLPGVEAKLADDGELLLKGPMVFKRYRGKPELTAAAFDDDGWLITGDIFEQDAADYYHIIDRKKEIIVSSTGKNISPVYVENTVSAASALIGIAVCIGDARPYTTALILLEPEATAGFTGASDPAANARNPKVREAVTDAVREANEAMNSSEQVKRFRIVEELWLPGGDELTPTAKLKRKPIAEKHAALIETLYGPKSEDVIDV